MRYLILVLCLASTVLSQDDLDDLYKDVFTSPAPAGPPNPIPQRPPQSNTQRPQQPNLQPNSGAGGVCSINGQDGECVPYYLCNNNSQIVTDGQGIIDIRAGGECDSYLDICCLPPDVRPPDNPVTPLPPPSRTGGCGFRNVDGVGYRIKGDKDNEAQFGEFPWMVAIIREEPVAASGQKLNIYQCGGSLIHPQVVLTAAHCIPKSKESKNIKLKVRAGEWDTQTKKEILPHQDRGVSKTIVHEHFYSGGLFNDIALLILDSAVDEADNVGVVCLPPPAAYAPQARCTASGWGKDSFGKEGRYQVILKKVELPIVDKARCQSTLRKTRLGSHFELHRSFICAGGEPGKDTCKGDGGSPLVCPMPSYPDRYMQSGIVAWGIGCNEANPGVYTNVALLREWIDEQLQLHNIDMSAYQV